ncbi:MAG: hypothetical protein ACKKL5_00570 [Candidatus Komeilibacteria bacterium]
MWKKSLGWCRGIFICIILRLFIFPSPLDWSQVTFGAIKQTIEEKVKKDFTVSPHCMRTSVKMIRSAVGDFYICKFYSKVNLSYNISDFNNLIKIYGR